MAGRKFSSVGSNQAQNYIISSLINNGVHPFQGKYRHPFQHDLMFSYKEGNNIIGYIKGTSFPNQYIVLSAHYDHLGKKGTKIYNGADDNASGTAALLTFGELIAKKPLKYSVILLFSDGEEVNLLGSKAFTNEQKLLLPSIRLNMNLDMIAGDKRTTTLHFVNKRLDELLRQDKLNYFKTIASNFTINVKQGFKRESYHSTERVDWINASDHASFNNHHIPFIYFGVGVHKNYHTTQDDIAHANIDFHLQACQVIFQYLVFFDENILPFKNKS